MTGHELIEQGGDETLLVGVVNATDVASHQSFGLPRDDVVEHVHPHRGKPGGKLPQLRYEVAGWVIGSHEEASDLREVSPAEVSGRQGLSIGLMSPAQAASAARCEQSRPQGLSEGAFVDDEPLATLVLLSTGEVFERHVGVRSIHGLIDHDCAPIRDEHCGSDSGGDDQPLSW